MKILSITVAAAALLLAPTTANAQLFGGLDNSTVLGGLAGAGLGGAIGSNLAGSGNRDEGTAIGAALGGLAGASFGNRNSNYYGNPYAGSFNPGFSGRSLLGTAVGAGLGGAIGSNLAGSGVRQEGTAIGAVLGGLAGNALSKRTRYGNTGFGGAGFAGAGFGAPNFGPVGPAGFGSGFIPPSYGPSFPPVGLSPVGLPPVGLPPMPMGGTSFVPGGFVNAGTFASTVPAPAPLPFIPAPTPVYQPLSTAFTGVTVAAPNITLAGPTIRKVHSHSARYGDSIGSTVTQNYVGSTGVAYQPKPLVLRSAPAPKSQVVVIERDHYTPSASMVSTHTHSSGHSHDSGFVAPLRKSNQGGGIYAETVNINYGNNSQVGTTSSNNGSTVGGAGHGHGHSSGFTTSYAAPAPVYTAPSAPIDFGDGIGDGTWGYSAPVGGSITTGSYTVGSASVLGGSSRYADAASSSYIAPSSYSAPYVAPIAPVVAPSPSSGAGGSYFVGSGQSFQAPSASQFNANCAATSAGCGSAPAATSYNWSTPSHGSQASSHGASSGYSFCGDDKVYNSDGALVVNSGPYCRN